MEAAEHAIAHVMVVLGVFPEEDVQEREVGQQLEHEALHVALQVALVAVVRAEVAVRAAVGRPHDVVEHRLPRPREKRRARVEHHVQDPAEEALHVLEGRLRGGRRGGVAVRDGAVAVRGGAVGLAFGRRALPAARLAPGPARRGALGPAAAFLGRPLLLLGRSFPGDRRRRRRRDRVGRDLHRRVLLREVDEQDRADDAGHQDRDPERKQDADRRRVDFLEALLVLLPLHHFVERNEVLHGELDLGLDHVPHVAHRRHGGHDDVAEALDHLWKGTRRGIGRWEHASERGVREGSRRPRTRGRGL